MPEESETINNEEFYHKDLFGAVVDLAPAEADEDEDMVGPKGRPDFNIWSFTDAMGTRNKKEAWILYQKAIASGLAPEEIFYKVVWQVKMLLLAKRTSTAKEAGMKDYPYSKAKGNLKKWKEGELENISEELVLGYHEARRGKGEIETLVERVILSL